MSFGNELSSKHLMPRHSSTSIPRLVVVAAATTQSVAELALARLAAHMGRDGRYHLPCGLKSSAFCFPAHCVRDRNSCRSTMFYVCTRRAASTCDIFAHKVLRTISESPAMSSGHIAVIRLCPYQVLLNKTGSCSNCLLRSGRVKIVSLVAKL